MLRRLFLLTATCAAAGEAPVMREPFRIEKEFEAVALPAEPVVCELDPEAWTSFVIESIADHGSPVKKGEVVVAFEQEDFQHRLADLKREVEKKRHAVAQAEAELAKLEAETELKLDAAHRAKRDAEEDLAYFRQTGRPAAEKETAHGIEVSKFRLAAEEEELKQLQAMYEEDDLTEETEEIILERQKFAVEDARFDLGQAERRAKLALETHLPRQEEELAKVAAAAAVALTHAEKSLPAAIGIAKLDLAAATTALERDELELARLKKDASLFAWKAPADGILLHGEVADGSWQLGELAKSLRPGSGVPLHRGLLTLAPADGPVAVAADLEPALAAQLAEDADVSLHPKGREDLVADAIVAGVAAIPGTGGKRHIGLKVEWPQNLAPAPLTPLSCRAIVYHNDEALTVPKEAVSAEPGGWSVTVKLADGNTETRPVERGRVGEKRIEILSGIEAGQVVVTPN